MTIYFISNEGHNLKISAFRSHFLSYYNEELLFAHIFLLLFLNPFISLSLYLSLFLSHSLIFSLSISHYLSLSFPFFLSPLFYLSLSPSSPNFLSSFFSISHPHSLIFPNYLALFYHLQSPGHFIEMIPQFPLSLVLIRDKMACGIFECDQIANSYPSNQ